MMIHRPALQCVVPLIAGIIIGWLLSIPLWMSTAMVCILIILAMIMRRSRFITILIYLILIGLGVVKITFDAKYTREDNIGQVLFEGERPAIIEGIVSEAAIRHRQSISWYLEVEHLYTARGKMRINGHVIVTVSLNRISSVQYAMIRYGNRVKVNGILSAIPPPRNP